MSQCCFIIILHCFDKAPFYHLTDPLFHQNCPMSYHCNVSPQFSIFAIQVLHNIITVLHFHITVIPCDMILLHYTSTIFHCHQNAQLWHHLFYYITTALHCVIRMLYFNIASYTAASHCSTMSSWWCIVTLKYWTVASYGFIVSY